MLTPTLAGAVMAGILVDLIAVTAAAIAAEVATAEAESRRGVAADSSVLAMVDQSALTFNCPICGKPTQKDASPDFPFCSERCRLLDLGNWASERYVVSQPVIDEDELETPKEDNEPDR